MTEVIRVKVKLAENTETYVISDLDSDDEGRYFCKVSNGLGVKEIFVDVKMFGL